MRTEKVSEYFMGTEWTLSSGARLWARQLERSDRYYIGLGVPVGAECDTAGREGAAHFLEHVAFRGGKRFPSEMHLREYLTPISGGFPHGCTNRQYTYYDLSVLPEFLLRGLEVLPSLLFDVQFQGIELERSIIEQERQHDLNQINKISGEAVDAALTLHPNWQHLVIGTAAGLRSIAADDLKQFHQQWYNTGNLYGVIIGPRPEEIMLESFASSLSSLPAQPSREPQLPRPPLIPPGTCVKSHWSQWDACFSTAVVALGIELPCTAEHRRLAKVVARIMDDGPGSPLFQSLRSECGLVYCFDMHVKQHRRFNQLQFVSSVGQERVSSVVDVFEKTVRDERLYVSFLESVAKHKLIDSIRHSHLSPERVGRLKLEALLEHRELSSRNEEMEALANLTVDELVDFVRYFIRPQQWRMVEIVPAT